MKKSLLWFAVICCSLLHSDTNCIAAEVGRSRNRTAHGENKGCADLLVEYISMEVLS